MFNVINISIVNDFRTVHDFSSRPENTQGQKMFYKIQGHNQLC